MILRKLYASYFKLLGKPKLCLTLPLLIRSVVIYWWPKYIQMDDMEMYYMEELLKFLPELLWWTENVITILSIFYLFRHIRRDRITGRIQLFLYDHRKLCEFVISEKKLRNLNESDFLEKSDPLYKRVSSIADNLINYNQDNSTIRYQEWKIKVYRDPREPLGTSCIDGTVCINSEIAEHKSDDELAFTIGHEMIHCAQKHLNSIFSFITVLYVIQIVSTLYLTENFLIPTLVNIVVHNWLVKMYRWHLEYVADEDGQMLAAKANKRGVGGYTLKKYLMILEDDNTKNKQLKTLLSNHPASRKRAQRLHKLIHKAETINQSLHKTRIQVVNALRGY